MTPTHINTAAKKRKTTPSQLHQHPQQQLQPHPAAMPATATVRHPPPVPRATAATTCSPSPWQAMTMCCVRCLVHLGRQWQWECAAVLPDPWCDVLHCSVLWCAARCCWWRHDPLCAVLQCLWCAMVCGVLHFSVVRCVCCTLFVLGCAALSCRSNSVLLCCCVVLPVLRWCYVRCIHIERFEISQRFVLYNASAVFCVI